MNSHSASMHLSCFHQTVHLSGSGACKKRKGWHTQPRQRCRISVVCQAGVGDRKGFSAIVIGAGFSGLSAAAGLSKHFDQVTLLDKDKLSDAKLEQENAEPKHWRERYEAETRRRQGVSQYKQPHVMLGRGLQTLEGLFPGYKQELSKAGALDVDWLDDIVVHDWGQDWRPSLPDHGLRMMPGLAASRHLYETVLRKFVLGVDNIHVQTNAAVNMLEYDADKQRVTGVKLKDGQVLEADLTVDASGKHSHVSKWLEQIGHEQPPTMAVESGLQYTYRMFQMPEDTDRHWSIAICIDHPEYTRTGVMCPIETNKWQLNLSGYPGYHCPLDEEGFLEFARQLPTPDIYNAIAKAEPVSSISAYRNTGNFRRLFEKAPPPNGFCAVGDAVCCFNPINGQGITVGLMGSELLTQCVGQQLKGKAGSERQHRLAALDGLPVNFHKQLGKLVDYPWMISVGPDAQKPTSIVKMPKQAKSPFAGLLSKYFIALQQAAYSDFHVMLELAKVQHMLLPPTALFAPGIVGKTLLSLIKNKIKIAPSQKNVHGSKAAGEGTAAAAAAAATASYGNQSE